ncbi:MAG TPA: response regulator [Cyclobacteriaceae bacterium]|nr:response regulator [Cyclobacteriaceae bacterium]
MYTPSHTPRHILLADDDDDDRLLFTDVLSEFSRDSKLTFAYNGEHLMNLLYKGERPDVLFLDLNMPLKNGMECLDEIRADKNLKSIPVVIFSTSSHPGTINRMYEIGAHLYIRKPNDFDSLRRVIRHVLGRDWVNPVKPPKEQFVLGL